MLHMHRISGLQKEYPMVNSNKITLSVLARVLQPFVSGLETHSNSGTLRFSFLLLDFFEAFVKINEVLLSKKEDQNVYRNVTEPFNTI